MMVEVVRDNLFASDCQTLVNTVNCRGVMGKGLALEFRLRFPHMFTEYQALCASGRISIGAPWLYKGGDKGDDWASRWILNFPTKDDWKLPTKERYLHEGLRHFVSHYRKWGVRSIAFPLLGAQNGGLSESLAIGIMREHLESIDIDVRIHRYDPQSSDDLHPLLRRLHEANVDVGAEAGLGSERWLAIQRVIGSTRTIGQLVGALKGKGVGAKSLERLIGYLCHKRARSIVVVTADGCQQASKSEGDICGQLRRVLERHAGPQGCPVHVRFNTHVVELGRAWRIMPSSAVLSELRSEFGEGSVAFDSPLNSEHGTLVPS